MRRIMLTLLLGSTSLLADMAAAPQGGAADLCQELLAYAEKKAAEPPKKDEAAGQTGSSGQTGGAAVLGAMDQHFEHLGGLMQDRLRGVTDDHTVAFVGEALHHLLD